MTEQLTLPGKVHADEVWREARRRQLEVIKRSDTYEATQDGSVRTATRGSRVMVNHDVLSHVHSTLCVTSATGQVIVLDGPISPKPGIDYAIRFRVIESPEDTIGTSVVRPVKIDVDESGQSQILTLLGKGLAPQPDDLIHIGPLASESRPMIVTNVEITRDMCTILRLVDAAAEIDTTLADTQIPAWSSRAGAELESI